MARTNFQYEKRQRELEKKRKADEKARRKQDAKRDTPEGSTDGQAIDAAQPEEGSQPIDAAPQDA